MMIKLYSIDKVEMIDAPPMFASPCCFHLAPLRHWSPHPELQKPASGSSGPGPTRNLPPPVVWMELLSRTSPAERSEGTFLYIKFEIKISLHLSYRAALYRLTLEASGLGSCSASASSSSRKYTSTPLSLSSPFAFFVFFFFFGTSDSACFWQ